MKTIFCKKFEQDESVKKIKEQLHKALHSKRLEQRMKSYFKVQLHVKRIFSEDQNQELRSILKEKENEIKALENE